MIDDISIKFKEGIKYQLYESKFFCTGIAPPGPIKTEYLTMDETGGLYVKAGYAWDGPSGPAIDSKAMMPASLIHDAIYQLMREEWLPPHCRDHADRLFREFYKQAADRKRPSNKWLAMAWDAMTAVRAAYTFHAVDKFASSAANPANRRPVLTAP